MQNPLLSHPFSRLLGFVPLIFFLKRNSQRMTNPNSETLVLYYHSLEDNLSPHLFTFFFGLNTPPLLRLPPPFKIDAAFLDCLLIEVKARPSQTMIKRSLSDLSVRSLSFFTFVFFAWLIQKVPPRSATVYIFPFPWANPFSGNPFCYEPQSLFSFGHF